MNISLLKPQYEFLTCTDPIAFFIGGVAVGKSFTLAHVVLKHIVDYPKSNILLTANTHQQLVSATVPALLSVLDSAGVSYISALSGARRRIEVKGVTIFLYSLERHDNIRGIEVGLVCGDEIAYSSAEAINVIQGRLRCKYGSRTARYVSSPNGYNFLYDFINKHKCKVIKMKTIENRHIPEDTQQMYKDLYCEGTKLYDQECNGEFVNISEDAVYYAFDRERHVKPVKYNPEHPLYVGQDFNISNQNSVFAQYYNDTLYVVSEKTLEGDGANTFDAGLMLAEAYNGASKRIVADSTGNARKTSARHGDTDIQILKDMGLHVLPFTNPLIKDRQNSVNKLLFLNNIQIDPSCKGLIKEFETLTHKKKEGDVAHLSPALGYLVWKLAPIKKPQAKTTQIINPFL